jgi:16S rRNA (uracil1498-N3)-methyltransferase
MPRFYAPAAQWSGDRVLLDDAEGRHAVEVLRLKEGAVLSIFDGAGRVASARLIAAGKRRVEAEIQDAKSTAAPVGKTTLVQALPKGKLFEWILEKAVELGVSRVVPLLTERTVVHLEGSERERKREKWERVVIEACKQCGQNWMPEIALPVILPMFLKESPPPVSIVASLHPGALKLKDTLPSNLSEDALVLVGPEGDFTSQEMERIIAWGARPVTLGDIVLRVETAAMFCLSVVGHLRQ